MKRNRFDAVVFDLDGVLIDSRPQMEFVFRECFRVYGPGGDPPLNAFFQRMGMPLPQILAELGLPRETEARYRDLSRRLYKQIRLIPEAHSTLSMLKACDIPVGLLTGKDRERTLEILNYFGLRSFFRGTVCGDDDYPGKPAPDGFLSLVSEWGVRPARSLMVGDSVLDVRCGLAAGAVTIGAGWGFESHELLSQAGAHECFLSFSEFRSWVESCLGASASILAPG